MSSTTQTQQAWAADFDFQGKVAIVTGAGAGLGRCYALLLARYGARVVVNDLGVATNGAEGEAGVRPADGVVEEIKGAGGVAVADYNSCVDGEKVVKTALDAFGRIDIIVNNAGILRDCSFHKMSKKDFDLVHLVHVQGAKNVTQAAWPHFREQGFGRVVLITSVNGLYGAFGQANYSSAKSAMVGLGKTLAKEGLKRNIKVNVVAPGAGSRMTKTVMPEFIVDAWKAEYVAPMVGYLCHEKCEPTGCVFEAGGGFFGQVKYVRSGGFFADLDAPMGIETIAANLDKITRFDDEAEDPEDPENNANGGPQLKQIMARL